MKKNIRTIILLSLVLALMVLAPTAAFAQEAETTNEFAQSDAIPARVTENLIILDEEEFAEWSKTFIDAAPPEVVLEALGSDPLRAPVPGWTYFGSRQGSVQADQDLADLVDILANLFNCPVLDVMALAGNLRDEYRAGLLENGMAYYQIDYYIDYEVSAEAGGDLYIREISYFYADADLQEFIDSEVFYFWSLTFPIVNH